MLKLCPCLFEFSIINNKTTKQIKFFSLKLSGSFIKGLYYPQNYCDFNYLVPFITHFFLACFHLFLIIISTDIIYRYIVQVKKTYFDFVKKQSFRYMLLFKMG